MSESWLRVVSVLRLAAWIVAVLVGGGWVAEESTSFAAPIVPGTGTRAAVIDDFEDPEWVYIPNAPKSSNNIDKMTRSPTGKSKNGQVYESTLRGQPDLIKRVLTPEGGLPGSEGSLLMRSLYTGVPDRATNDNQQDDLIVNVNSKVGGFLLPAWSPSTVVRVYVPPFEKWEQRTGTSFGFRADVRGRKKRSDDLEAYWPGFFIQFNSKTDRRRSEDSAVILIRGNQLGHEVVGPTIKEAGWWTLGMSFSSDGQVHFYARPGVEDLRPEDRIVSHYCYGFKCERFHSVFFNIANFDNGRNWSTPWIVDDPAVYYTRR